MIIFCIPGVISLGSCKYDMSIITGGAGDCNYETYWASKCAQPLRCLRESEIPVSVGYRYIYICLADIKGPLTGKSFTRKRLLNSKF